MSKSTQVSGKRKRAIARATITEGNGTVRINSLILDAYQPQIARMKIQEPIILAGDQAKKLNINVSIQGGGFQSQAEAARLAIARGLVEHTGSKELRKIYLDYDRQMLIADVRRNETSKPNTSKPRAKRQKSYR